MNPYAKQKVVLPNGRNRKHPTQFEDLWAKMVVHHIIHPAWRNLTTSAKDVYMLIMIKNSHAGWIGRKDGSGKPKVVFSYSEAKKLLNMPSPTFSRALKELQAKGFVGMTECGGIVAGRGKAAQYHLSGEWMNWQPPKRDNSNLTKARAALKKKKKLIPR